MKLLISFILSFSLYAAMPSEEVLLNNLNNNEYELSTTILNFEVVNIPVNEEEIVEKYDIELVYYQRDNTTRYVHKISKDNEIIAARVIKGERNYEAWLMKQDIAKNYFYGLLHVFYANDSKKISNLLKNIAPSYRTNRQLINFEKMSLLEKYEKHLAEKKSDKDNDDLVSPVDPENEDEKAKVKDVLNAPMYRDSGNVSLVNINKQFFWELNLGNFTALFSNESRRMLKSKLINDVQAVETYTSNYILYNGTHELPKNFILKINNENKYKVRFKKILTRDWKYQSLHRAVLKELKGISADTFVHQII